MSSNLDEAHQNNNVVNTSPEKIEKIKLLLFELINLFEKNRIHYWLDSGTLLGCIRDNQIIPWDDDGDLGCFENDKNMIYTILRQNKINDRWLENKNTYFHYFFSKQDQTHVDIFFYKEMIPGIMVFKKDQCLHIYKDYLLQPLPQKEFYQRLVNIPRNTENFLIQRYGSDYLQTHHKYKSGGGGSYKENLPEVFDQQYQNNKLLFLSLTCENGRLFWEKPLEKSNQIFSLKNNQLWSLLERMTITKDRKNVLILTSPNKNKLTWKIIPTRENRICLQEKNTHAYLAYDDNKNQISNCKMVNDIQEAARIQLKYLKGGFTINLIKEIYPAKNKSDPKIIVFLLAGGTGQRFNDELPKQFHTLHQNKPILYYSLKTIELMPIVKHIILVIPKKYESQTQDLLKEWLFSKVQITFSGHERSTSILNAYHHYRKIGLSEGDFVIINDVVRPLVSQEDYYSLIEEAKFYGIVGFKIQTKLTNTFPHTICTETGLVVKYLPRGTILCQNHCPMIIHLPLLIKFINKLIEIDFNHGSFEKIIGISPKLIDGNTKRLLKITFSDDLTLAKQYLLDSTKI